MTDFDFKRHRSFPYDVTWGDGTRHGVMMDGLLAFAFDDKEDEDKQFLLEVKTGSHAPAAIKEKVKNLVLFIHQSGFQKVFDTDLFSGYLFFAMGVHEKLTPDWTGPQHMSGFWHVTSPQLNRRRSASESQILPATVLAPERLFCAF